VNAIEVRDVFRIYQTREGDAAALQGLTMSVREGEVLVVLGPSGSGKSTLLQLLAGLDRPSAGSVRVFGVDVGKLTGRALGAYRSDTLGYADQHYARALVPELTARELVALQPALRGARKQERLAHADALLEHVGLQAKRNSRPRELSGGEQQRVALCAALAHGPRIFLADEPTGELDHANALLVYEAIAELTRAHGCTTVIVSHDPESATIADRVVRIRDGRVSEEWARESGGEDAIVVGRGGWLRLPEELLNRAGIRTHAVARLEDNAIVVTGTDRAVPDSPVEVRGSEPLSHSGRLVAEVRGLTRRFAATTALDGLDASFSAGRLTAVTGPSGSGKTTLLHLLAGLDLPSSGEVFVLGRRIDELSRDERAVLRAAAVGFVGQQPGLVPFLSAKENVELGLALRVSNSELQARFGIAASSRADELLAAVGLTERASQRLARLSTGERARVAIARALAPQPKLLLVDEPTSRLDQANAVAVTALLAQIAREHDTAVVCATHDPLVIDQADDRLELSARLPTLEEVALEV
jgi:ABC-type lipoprotein export system ATPase subunit